MQKVLKKKLRRKQEHSSLWVQNVENHEKFY